MSWAIHWSNPKNTYFGPICFWLFIGAILRIHILVQYVLGLICFGSNMFWYEYVLGTICFGMNMFWSNMFPNMFWAQYVFVQYVLARHDLDLDQRHRTNWRIKERRKNAKFLVIRLDHLSIIELLPIIVLNAYLFTRCYYFTIFCSLCTSTSVLTPLLENDSELLAPSDEYLLVECQCK